MENYPVGIEFMFHFQSGRCIKELIWPPLDPKAESCFSAVSSNWFIRRMVVKFWHLFKLNGCYGNKNGLHNRPKIEKLTFWAKFEASLDRFFNN